jgi:membrane associated rhomboid family serine protease
MPLGAAAGVDPGDVLPLRDENPTRRPAVATAVLILACVGTFVFIQPSATRSITEPDTAEVVDEIEFAFEYAAIPCELAQGRPLTAFEITRTATGDPDACLDDPRGPVPFPDKRVWLAVVVSLFLHSDWFYLIGNMVFLWVFGNNIEDHLGIPRYLLFYVLAGIVGTVAHVVLQLDSTVPLVGASGAVAGVMGAYLVWFPWARVRTLFLIVIVPVWPRIPAAALLLLWFAAQFFTDTDAGIAWAAHVAGFAFGAFMAWVASRDPRFRNRLWAHRYRTTGAGPWNNRLGPPITR